MTNTESVSCFSSNAIIYQFLFRLIYVWHRPCVTLFIEFNLQYLIAWWPIYAALFLWTVDAILRDSSHISGNDCKIQLEHATIPIRLLFGDNVLSLKKNWRRWRWRRRGRKKNCPDIWKKNNNNKDQSMTAAEHITHSSQKPWNMNKVDDNVSNKSDLWHLRKRVLFVDEKRKFTKCLLKAKASILLWSIYLWMGDIQVSEESKRRRKKRNSVRCVLP